MDIRNINQKTILIGIIALLSIVLIFVLYKKNIAKKGGENNQKKGKETATLGEKTVQNPTSQQQLQQYYALYENPYVLHLREILDVYLDGDLNEESEGIDDYEVVVEKGKRDDGNLTGLDSFDEDYYESKFVVILMVTTKEEGKVITIIFQEKPDKLFNAGVIETDEDEYELYGFWENIGLSDEQMTTLKEKYKELITDEEHAI